MLDRIIIIYLIGINIIAFILYGVDKIKAVAGKWRVTEASLIGIATIGGCFGAFIGMRVWHHKTRKLMFQVLVPLLIIIWIAIILYWKGFLSI